MTAQGAEPGTLERVSVANGGAERNKIETGSTTACAPTTVGKCTKRTIAKIGDNAYRVVFTSQAPNLVGDDSNQKADVFVAEISGGTVASVERVSVGMDGQQSDGDSEGGSISPNGRWVAFESRATNMAENDNKLAADVFVVDVSAPTLTPILASRASGATGTAGNQQSFSPSVADDGSVAFTSFATNLVDPSDVPAFQAVYVRRDPAGASPTTVIASVGAGGPADGPSLEPSISADGTRVAFTSGAKNMEGETEPIADEDIFVGDVEANSTTRITRGAKAFAPSISPGGSQVAFAAEFDRSGGGWGPGDGRKDIYVSSVSSPSPSLKSDCTCDASQDRPAVAPSINDAGHIAFQSAARFEPVTSEQIWTNKGGVAIVSKNGASAPDGVSEFASISPDGDLISFTSKATNLVVGDTNGAPDVFLKNLVDGTILRVSIQPPNTEASGFAAIPTSSPAIAGDGNLVVFESDSTNLVEPDENGLPDIFLRDRRAGTTVKITNGLGGEEPDGGSRNPDISRDGRWVVFDSSASNLVEGDTNGVSDVFLYDTQEKVTTRLSISASGFESTSASVNPDISPNGEWVTFESLSSLADVIAKGDSSQIYRLNRGQGPSSMLLVSRNHPENPGGAQAPDRDSTSPSVADDGSVAFLSESRKITAPPEQNEDPNAPAYQKPNRTDVFVRRADGTMIRGNPGMTGSLAQADSTDPVISADGRRVAFASAAGNLAPDNNTDSDVFLSDLATGSVELISIGLNGQTPSGRSTTPAINRDGSLVAFVSTARNLVADDTNERADVFLASPGAVTRRISVKTDGAQANNDSFTPSIGANGNTVAFQSLADNLVDGDNNNSFDAFVRDLLDSDRPCTVDCGGVGVGGGDPGGPPSISNLGYRFVAADGGIFNFGSEFYGSAGDLTLNHPIIGMASTPNNGGYWLVASDGGIFSFGNAKFYGSTGDIKLNSPIVGMASTPTGNGYWYVAADGGIFSFGDAEFRGSMGGQPLNRPIVAMASTKSGQGYWLVASDGGIFSYGDAEFLGSTGDIQLNKPIVGMDRSASSKGYRFVASDGGIFSFGDAEFLGSTGDIQLNKPIVGMGTTRVGDGYWLVASDGGVFSFGDAEFLGSTGDIKLNSPIVGMAG